MNSKPKNLKLSSPGIPFDPPVKSLDSSAQGKVIESEAKTS